MNKILSGAILFLLAALFAVSIYAIRLRRDVYGIAGWKDQLYAMSSVSAAYRALGDFRRGQKRLFIIDGQRDSDLKTNRKDGSFEVWAIQNYPSLGTASLFTTQQVVETYNSKMRYMDAHAERFPIDLTSKPKNTAEQGAAANP